MSRIHIPDLFANLRPAVENKANIGFVYFQYGHYDAVNKLLIAKGESISFKNTKYPLIWVVTPIDQITASNQDYYCELQRVDILIMVPCNPEEPISQRASANFVNKLYPIVEALKEAMCDSGSFQILSPEAINPGGEIEVIDWYYQPNAAEKRGNLFNDTLDAVQIKIPKLRVNPIISRTRIFN